MVRYGEPGVVEWVESTGPLVVLPEAELPSWLGIEEPATETDYDRACAVGGRVGLIPVGQATGLVLGDDPTGTSFVPEHGAFVRWCAADSEDGLLGSVGDAMREADWEPELYWDVPGPVVLFDAALPGIAVSHEDHVRVPLDAGRYAVRAGYAEPDLRTRIGLVRLRGIPVPG